MLRHREFDVAEMSLSSYTVILLQASRSPFVAIPVFPSRFFRHSSIYVNAEVRHPRAQGPHRQTHRRARIPDDRAGVDPRHPVRRLRRAGRRRHVSHRRRGRAGPAGETEARSAAKHPASSGSGRGQDAVARCCATARSTRSTLRASLRPTGRPQGDVGCSRITSRWSAPISARRGIFPIMHTVAIRRDVYEANRWVAQSLSKAFLEAQRRT